MIVGGVRYPTKVEVSFRERHADDRVAVESPDATILATYGLDRLDLPHYVREAAVRQKIEALGGRREAQARDIFDLYVLLPAALNEGLLELLARAVDTRRLQEAHERALTISYTEFEGQVSEFLGEEARPRYANKGAWDEMRLRVATLVESVLKTQQHR